MRYTLLVTGPAYGTQHASSALLFAHALIKAGHKLESIFFYQEGVFNANKLNFPAEDEVNMVSEWKKLKEENNISLNVCTSAALRRGIVSKSQISKPELYTNMQYGFELSGLGTLAEAIFHCDRLVQF